MGTEPKTNELALQKENLHLKQSIAALREQMEKLEAAREEAVQKTLHATQDEITQLRAAVAAMRDQLENTCYEKDCAAMFSWAAQSFS